MKLSIFHFCFATLLSSVCFAQPAYNFRQLSVGQGLPGENVRSIFQDPFGFLWFGIESEGLCKYNGAYFENFSQNDQDSLIISTNYINGIAGDLNGNLWLATEKGLNIFDRYERKYYKYTAPLLNHNVCLSVSCDSSGVIWLGTAGGLMKFVPKKEKEVAHQLIGSTRHSFNYIQEEDELTKSLQGETVKIVFQENANSFWVGTDTGLFHYDNNKKSINHWHKNQGANSLSNNEISDILPLNKDYFLIGTDNGVNLMERKTNTFSRIAFKNSSIFNDAKVGVVDIHKDYKGVIWIGTSSYGIIKGEPYLENRKALPIAIQTPRLVQGVSSKHIMKIFEDNSGQLWISTKFGGTYIFDKRSQTFPLFTLEGSDEDNIENHNFILSSKEDPDGNLWIGTRDRGILKYNPKNQSFRKYPVFKGKWPIRRIEYLHYSSDKKVWLGHKGGVSRLNPQTNEQTYFKLPKVQAIFENESHNLWLGTTEGIFVYDQLADSIVKHPSRHANLFDNPIINVEVIYPDKNGSLWIGTNNHGLYRYYPLTDSLAHFTHHPQDPKSISGNTIRSIMQDSNGRIWVGTKSSGLNLYVENKGFNHFKKNNGLPSNTIFSIIESNSNNFWIITNNGISKFNYEKNLFTNFSTSHGLQGNVFERRASLKLKNGKIFIAGNNGFNLFDPSSIRLENFDPPLVVTSVKANGEILEKDIISEKHIILPYNRNMLTLEFSSLDFRDPTSNQYAYKLEGLDNSWITSGTSNSVTYSNLNHGNYTFRFKATDADGNWTDARHVIQLTILRPPWLSWWAYVSYFLFALLLVYSLYYIATVRANYFHKLKTKEVELRQAKELHQMKLNFFTNISHELRTPLTLIIAPLEKLIKSTTPSDKIYSSIRAAYNSSRQLLHLADQLIYFRKAEQENLQLRVSQQNIVTYLQELVFPFRELAEKENIDLEFISSCPEINLWFDPDKAEKIFNNLLINAFKFTPKGGRIKLSITGFEEKGSSAIPCSFIKIQVQDTGKGMTKAELDFIFNRYYQADPLNVGAGIGLELVKRLIELHKGSIKVESEQGKGSCFTVLLPADAKNYTAAEMTVAVEEQQDHKKIPASSLLQGSLQEASIIQDNLNSKEPHHTLLIVEDNIELLLFLKENLREEFIVKVARNGKEAIEKLANLNPEIILSDIMMQEMNGLDFCKTVKEDLTTSHIPVVLLTAKTLEEQQIAGYEHGAEGYLLKPFDIEVVKAKLKSLVKNRQNFLKKIQSELLFEPKQIAATNIDEQFLKKLLSIVNSNFRNPDFHVEELASDLHLSRSQLFRKLKGLTGQTPSEYLYAYRISMAIKLLKEGRQNIAEIAYQTGFKSPNSFTKTFTKHMGVSPKKYKLENIT